MTAVVRIGDVCSGHDCWPSRPNVQGSDDVFINGIPAHRLSDAWAAHCCPDNGCHGAVAAQGSDNVFVNGLSLCRIGDAVSCGSVMVQGSDDVFAN